MATPYPKFSRSIRFRWYHLVDRQGKSVTEVCSLFGLSRKTYYHWRGRDFGRHAMRYRSHRPHPALKLTPEVRQLIEREKLLTNYGPLKMKLLLKRRLGLTVSTTVIYRYYQRRKLIRRPQKKLPWYEPLREPVRPEKPGDVVQLDSKYVWIKGKRHYQRTFVDVFTGLQHAVIVLSLESQDTVRAFLAAETVFPFPILAIQTDNGSENRGDFHQYLGSRGVAHYFIPKSSPQWNGVVERAHGVIDQEYYLNPLRPWHSLPEYLHFYNHERIHLGKNLHGLTPKEKYLQYQEKVLPLNVN
jgi:transposase